MRNLNELGPRGPLLAPDALGGASPTKRNIDTNGILSRWYNQNTTYIEGMEVTKDGIHIARFTFNPQTHSAADEKFKFVGGWTQGDGSLHTPVEIEAENLIGHAWALPLHKQVRMMVENMSSLYQRVSSKKDVRLQLAGYESLSSQKGITAGKTVEVVGMFTETDEETLLGTANTSIEISGKGTASAMKGLLFRELQTADESGLLEDQVIEAKAQAVVCALYENQEIPDNMVPLFGGTRKTTFFRRLKPGETALLAVSNFHFRKGFFSADVQTVSSGDPEDKIAQSRGLFGLLAPKDAVLAALA